MPEPTNHRAKAEDWTQDAKIHFIQAAERNDDGDLIGFDPEFMLGAQTAALIGIGHALLALTDTPTPSALGRGVPGTGTWVSNPPLSPSEG